MAAQVLAIYNHRLDERERRKAFILEQGLLVRKHDENKKKWGREEKELHRKIGNFFQHRLSFRFVRHFRVFGTLLHK